MASVFTIALTGGIGSGKSVVASLFEELGVPIIDSDAISKNIILPNKPCFKEIINQFGKKILTNEGTIDRYKLREIIFNDAVANSDPVIKAPPSPTITKTFLLWFLNDAAMPAGIPIPIAPISDPINFIVDLNGNL